MIISSTWEIHVSGLTKRLALVFLHEAENYETQDEQGHEGHSPPSHDSQHRHLHTRLQEFWENNHTWNIAVQ